MKWVDDMHVTTKFFKKEGEYKTYDMSEFTEGRLVDI